MNLRFLRNAALVGLFVLQLSARGGVLDDKTPPYFVDRYGSAKSSKTESSHSFLHAQRGHVNAKGQFSVREFKKGDLRVQPVFFLPSLKLASVRMTLGHKWTQEQVEAALVAYGGEWEPVKINGIIDEWVAPDGTRAISMLTSLFIQSKAVVDLVKQTLAEDDAKRKEIPKF